MRLQTELPAAVAEIKRARLFVREILAGAGLPPDLVDAAVLLTSEVVTNAMVHGRSDRPPHTVGGTVGSDGAIVRIEVRDGSSILPRRGDSGGGSPSGRGLLLLDTMTSGWGTDLGDGDGDGKSVWFELQA